MYLEKINITEFRVLRDIEICFQTPTPEQLENIETGNVINVIAGVNGCGKTSLLDAIFNRVYDNSNAPGLITYSDLNLSITLSEIGTINNNNLNIIDHQIRQSRQENIGKLPPYDTPRIIYLPSQQSFSYQPVSQLTIPYEFYEKIDTAAILGNAEFYIKEYIISHERASFEANPNKRTQQAVDSFNTKFLNAQLLTQLSGLSKEQFNRPVFTNVTGQQVTIEQLSDGEKQLYARVIALMLLEPRNSIILIDEPEIALHPAWQQKIMQIYAQIGKNNQFIVATHSPQILSSVPYQNRILLTKQDGKIQPIHLQHPPSGIDINSILSEIMGADPRPKELLDLYSQYRQFVEDKQENSEAAKNIKAELLSKESEHSRFMQEMAFLIELRDIT
jgi:predicted ATP-binding protein involved in virulence